MSTNLRIRAVGIDLGHGNVKCAFPAKGESDCKLMSFPSLAPVLPSGMVEDFAVAPRYEGVVVNVKGVSYFVGKDSHAHLSGTFSKPARDGYSHSAEYEALMKGALSHIITAYGAQAGDKVEIVCLGLGLPLTTYFNERDNLTERWRGDFTIPVAGGNAQVLIRESFALAQPVGALLHYAITLGATAVSELGSKISLVLDAGGGTLDYLVTSGGVRVAPNRSGANEHGLDSCIEAVAKKLGGKHAQKWLGNQNQLRAINDAVSRGAPLDLGDRVISPDEYWPHVTSVVNAGISGALRAVGDLTDVRMILCVGGGGAIYADALRKLSRDPLPPVRVEEQPLFTNVKGFYAQASRKAVSFMRSLGISEMEVA